MNKYEKADRLHLLEAEKEFDAIAFGKDWRDDEEFMELMAAAWNALHKARAYCWAKSEQED